MSKHTVHSPNKSGRETPPLTALSLFAGVGGFDLGFERAGIRVIAQCEIDPHAASVLRRHWPDVPVVSDVTTLNGAEYVADIITGGFPCQDLSVAGKRAGLDGERSGLFFEIVRIVHEMREATDGQYPRWVVLENVVGAFSSNGGADFAAVLQSLVGGEVRRPADGWTNAGVAFGPLGSVEWRVLDSQHFGVAQRRRRVFLVYHPGSERAGQVLLEPQGVPGDTPSRRAPGEGITGALTGGAGSSSAGNPDDNRAQAGFLIPEVMPTMRAGGGNDTPSKGQVSGDTRDEYIIPVEVDTAPTVTTRPGGKDASDASLVPVAFKVRGGKEGGGKGYLGSEDKALTISTVQEQYLAEPIAVDTYNQTTGPITHTLRDPNGTFGDALPAVAFVASDYSTGAYEPADKAEALTTSADRTRAAPITFDLAQITSKHNRSRVEPGLPAGTLAANSDPHVATPYAVRRLTPVECERLQGFPDSWTAHDHEGREIADTHRYRMMGNAVTVSVAEWIARRLKEALT